MEIKEVSEVPKGLRGMNENTKEILEALTNMEVGKTLRFATPEGRTEASLQNSIKNQCKRLPLRTYRTAKREDERAVYVTLKENKETEPEAETPKKEEKKKKKE